MQNRFDIDVRKGAKVRAHHPRGGTISGVVTRLYAMQGYGKRVELDTGYSVALDDVCEIIQAIAIPDEWRPVIGTLAHNRQFAAREITEYTRFDRKLDGRSVVNKLLKAGFIERVSEPEGFCPTAAGWKWIESALR